VYNVVVSDSLSVSLINRQGFPPPFSLDGFFFDIIKDERRQMDNSFKISEAISVGWKLH